MARRVELAHAGDLGYDLLTALAVGDRDGSPLAPLSLDLRAAGGVHTTRADGVVRAASPLDGLGPVMAHAAGLLAGTGEAGKPPVFVIDREADSVGHYRRWAAAGHRFVVRADDNEVELWHLFAQKARRLEDFSKPLLPHEPPDDAAHEGAVRDVP